MQPCLTTTVSLISLSVRLLQDSEREPSLQRKRQQLSNKQKRIQRKMTSPRNGSGSGSLAVAMTMRKREAMETKRNAIGMTKREAKEMVEKVKEMEKRVEMRAVIRPTLEQPLE